MKYESILCQCECNNCKKFISKNDYFEQGYCFYCKEWILTDEINECSHCKKVRKFEFERR